MICTQNKIGHYSSRDAEHHTAPAAPGTPKREHTMTTLLCTISNNGNAIAILEGQPTERFLISAAGEFKHDATLQFPDFILKDKISGEASPETLLREYFTAKMAAKKEAERVAKEQEEKAAAEMRYRFGGLPNALARLNEAQCRVDYVEPTVKALKAALKKAEAKEAKQKAEAAWEKLCVKACAALHRKGPKAPLKGAGFVRENWPSDGHNKKMEALLAAIPASHKDKIASRRQKGYFSWSVVVSPEALKKVAALIEKAKA